MAYLLNDFKKDIEKILSVCKEDKDEILKGNKRQATIEQIEETIIPEMNQLLIMIESKKIPPKDKRWIESAAYITRGWNWDIRSEDKLNILLPELDNKYRYDLID
jgi:hypothetical protein